MLPSKLAFVDIETTGSSFRTDRIIEIGVVRIEAGKITRSFQSLTNPSQHVPDEILALTHISRSQLDSSPSFYDILEDLLEILDDAVFVAHNARFDYSFLKQELSRFQIPFSPKQICTVKLSRMLYPKFKHHNLDAIIERFKIECRSRHRALDDALVIWQLFQIIQREFSNEIITQVVDKILKKPTVPLKIQPEQLDTLPESPGVYIFYGQNPLPLYIGKSVNIKKRVMSHFSSDYLQPTELKISQQVESIETISTSGELGALLLESDLIKKNQPVYNRRLRKSQGLICISCQTDKSGYSTVLTQNLSVIDPASLSQVLGVFKSSQQLKKFLILLAKEYKLCEKLLGVDNSQGACFGYRLGHCAGACLGQEPQLRYNLRFTEAFYASKLKTWPFDGPIIIREQSDSGQKTESFLIDNWCLLGTVKSEDYLDDVKLGNDVKFDLDVYKILRTFLNSPKNLKYIKPLKKAGFSWPKNQTNY